MNPFIESGKNKRVIFRIEKWNSSNDRTMRKALWGDMGSL
jgi:hypothetical protein